MNSKKIKKIAVLMFAGALAVSMNAFASAEVESSAEDMTGDDYFQNYLQGTYSELFPAFHEEKNDELWADAMNEYCGIPAEQAQDAKDAFLSIFESDVYGEDAAALAEEDETYSAFDCYMINDISSMSIEGNEIAGFDESGNEVFRHAYSYYDDVKRDFGAMNDVYSEYFTDETWPTMKVYVSDGEDDDFKYFAFTDDNPIETYHIEYRYGSNLDDLAKYYTGEYAYWLASAIESDYDNDVMASCINLFVSENADSIMAIAGADTEEVTETAETVTE